MTYCVNGFEFICAICNTKKAKNESTTKLPKEALRISEVSLTSPGSTWRKIWVSSRLWTHRILRVREIRR
jgi:hypothetical protein